MVTVAIALGSNLGDRAAHLQYACRRLGELLRDIRVSSFRETAPLDVAEPQLDYLNGVVVGSTDLAPASLLEMLHGIERERGRERPRVNAPRTLDLDLILLGDQVVSAAGLTLPHPRFRTRRFVLEPLAEIAPDLRDPQTGKTVRELLAELTLDGQA
jgi:2-amino-4-hydroxy-6-hydroxymethyldihydropteridine diphosphokinase